MKRVVKLIIVLFLSITLTGCVKQNIDMEIGKDKSVNLTVISAIKKGTYTEINPSQIADNLENKGFIKEPYKEDSWNGYKLTKKFDHIDKISTDKEITVELSDLLDKEKENIKYYFQKKKTFFKTTYIANFTIDINANADGTPNEDINGYKDSVDLKYTVKLPTSSTNQNTTNISYDGKTLTWLLEYGKINKIHYEFSMPNTGNYILLSTLFITIILITVYFIFKPKKKEKDSLLNKIIKFTKKKNKSK